MAASILNANFLRLDRAVEMIRRGGGDWVHVDVMDGHFVPNLSMGPYIVERLRAGTRLPLDVHLMVDNPGIFIDSFLRAGASGVTIHVEVGGSVRRLLRRIRRGGARAGISLRPSTPVSSLKGYLGDSDLVLVMTVDPGFGGQAFLRSSLGRIRELREMTRRMRHPPHIEVDGGIGARTVGDVVRAGANVIVAGHAIFGARDPVRALKNLRRLASAAQASFAKKTAPSARAPRAD